jgi:hypothetical protein
MMDGRILAIKQVQVPAYANFMYVVVCSVADQHRFDAYPDPASILVPIRIRIQTPPQVFTYVGKSGKKF